MLRAGGKRLNADRLAEGRVGSGDETVVDVGGGNGSRCSRCSSGGRACAASSSTSPRRTSTSLGDRLAFVGGSFFDEVPPADASC